MAITSPHTTTTPAPSRTAAGASTEDIQLPSELIDIKRAATLMKIQPATLRNYVWLLGLSKQERARRFLQEPPEKMPKPRRVRGRPVWPTDKFMAWLPTWQNRAK